MVNKKDIDKKVKKEKIEEPEDVRNDNIWVANSYYEKFLVSGSFGEAILKKDFRPKQAYRLAKLIKLIESGAETYLEIKKSTVDKHAMKDEEGKVVQNKDNSLTIVDIPAFNKDMQELLEVENDLGVKPIEFDFDQSPDLSIDEMNFLTPLITELEEE